MPPTITVSPNPVIRPTTGKMTANVYIGGLTPGTRYNIRVDATTKATASATREGSLAVGITVGTASKLGGHAVDVRDSANVTTLAEGTFTIADPAPPPPPITPTPDGRPFAPPTINQEVTVPPSVVDVAGLQYLIDHNPDRTRFLCSPNLLVGQDGPLLQNRQHLEFVKPRIRTTGGGQNTNASGFKLDKGNADIRIIGAELVGANPGTGTDLFKSGSEYAMGLCVFDGQRIEFQGTVSHTWGDGAFLAAQETAGSAHRQSQDVWIHDSAFDWIGRMGFVPKGVQRCVYERNTLDHVALIVFDAEQDYDFEIVDGLHIRDVAVGSYSLSPYQTNWLFAAAFKNKSPNLQAAIRDVWLERVTVTGGAKVNGYNPAGKGGLATLVDKTVRTQGFHMLDCSTDAPGNGPVLHFAHVDGLDVQRITQPLLGGSLIEKVDCT